jgi:glutaredoxin
MGKRSVEIFTAGCVLCDETVKLVNDMACPDCEITVYNLIEQREDKECMEKVKEYEITSVPTVVVNGKVAECCKRSKPNRQDLEALGIGQPFAG